MSFLNNDKSGCLVFLGRQAIKKCEVTKHLTLALTDVIRRTTMGMLNMPCPAVSELIENEIQVSFSVSGGNEVSPGDVLGWLTDTSRPKMTIRIRDRREMKPVVLAVRQDSEGDTHVQKVEGTVDGDYVVYEKNIPVMNVQGGWTIPQTYHRLYILVESRLGVYSLYATGAYAQKGQTSTWAERFEDGRVQCDEDGNLVLTTKSNVWAKIFEHLFENGHFDRRKLKITLSKGSVGNPTPTDVPNLPARLGQVVWFNLLRGDGMVWFRNFEGEIIPVKVHFSNVKPNRFGVSKLEPCQYVSGRLVDGVYAKGPKMGQRRLELQNVEIVEIIPKV